MYSENYNSKKTSFWVIILMLTVAFCLLSVPSWFSWVSFKGIYEILVLIGMSVALYSYIRRGFYKYTYIINEDIITVVLKLGSKDTVLCMIPIGNIHDIQSDMPSGSFKEKGIKNIMRCNGDLFGSKGMNIVYTDAETGTLSVLIFNPSEKFTEILQSKRIDKCTEV